MNSRGYTMTSLSIVLLAVTIMSVSGIGQVAYAQGGGMSLTAEGSGSTINVWGSTDRIDLDVTMVVTASNGNIIQVAQLSASDGKYATTINVSGWNDGAYKIAVNQGSSSKYSLSVDIDVSGGTSTSSAMMSNMVATEEVKTESTDAMMGGGLMLTAEGEVGSTTINVWGTTDRNGDITLRVWAPNGNLVSVSQISPSDGSYMTTVETGGQQWSQDGMYTISASQGSASNYNTSAQVEIIDGHIIPEFGTIAAMILVVAIVSIIAVTAKTRLSLVPRY